MEAKDTTINLEEAPKIHIEVEKNFSYRAGRKEVIDWILNNGYESCDGAGDDTWVLDGDKLDAQLKEWGVK